MAAPSGYNGQPADSMITKRQPISTPQQPMPAVMVTVDTRQSKSLLEAYMLSFPLGFLGLHHFYLRRYGFGFLYIFTFGLLGFGVLVDWFRMPWLVADANDRIKNPQIKDAKRLDDAYMLWFVFGLLGFHHFYLRKTGLGFLYLFTLGIFGIGWLVDLFLLPSHVRKENAKLNTPTTEEHSLVMAYAFNILPFGLLGAHHFYLRRYFFGIVYFLTFGLLGVGWFLDLFRLPILVKRANIRLYNERNGIIQPEKYTLDDAYIMWFPFGLAGFHHFYLRRYIWGILYKLTLGLFGVGWIIDLFRMPSLVEEANNRLMSLPLYVTPLMSGTMVTNYQTNNMTTASSGVSMYPNPPAYASQEVHGNGKTNVFEGEPPPYTPSATTETKTSQH